MKSMINIWESSLRSFIVSIQSAVSFTLYHFSISTSLSSLVAVHFPLQGADGADEPADSSSADEDAPEPSSAEAEPSSATSSTSQT